MVALSDVMTPDVVTLSAEASVGEAAKVMVRGGFGSVVVVQGRMLLGILTERDVLCVDAVVTGRRGAFDLLDREVEPEVEPEVDQTGAPTGGSAGPFADPTDSGDDRGSKR